MKKYYPELRRLNHGAVKRKHGIVLTNLYPEQQKLLIENEFLKDIVNEDLIVYALFKIQEIEQQNRKKEKLWYNPYTDIATTYKQIIEDSEYVIWSCAICNEPIKSNMSNFNPDNFCCDDCSEVFADSITVDYRITQSSLDFTNHCKDLLLAEQREVMKMHNKEKQFENKTYKI